MKLTEEQYELIEAYLKNELSPNDKLAFEKEMQANNELKDEVDLQDKIRLGLQSLGIQRAIDRAKTQYNESLSVQPISKISFKVTNRNSNWRYWVAAASVTAILGIGYYTYQQTEKQYIEFAYSETIIPDSQDELIKSFPMGDVAPTTRTRFLDAFKNYEDGKYDRVIEQLKTLPSDKQTIDYKNYFLGLSYLANKQASKAIPLLTIAQSSSILSIRLKAEWFLALSYVKNNQKEKALSLLKQISMNKANPYQPLAKKVLAKIQ